MKAKASSIREGESVIYPEDTNEFGDPGDTDGTIEQNVIESLEEDGFAIPEEEDIALPCLDLIRSVHRRREDLVRACIGVVALIIDGVERHRPLALAVSRDVDAGSVRLGVPGDETLIT